LIFGRLKRLVAPAAVGSLDVRHVY
jgi:hypothetical protein